LFIFGNTIQKEVYKSFASEMFILASHRLPLFINPLKAELNPICHLLSLLGAHHILHVSRIRVNFSVSRQLGSKNYGAVPWLRQLVAGLLLQRPKFRPRPVQMGFLVHKVALGQVFL